ncbi:MAG: zeta toxin family protein, partial [Streptosporangiaceae bacterium]
GEPGPEKRLAESVESVESGETDAAEQAEARTRQEHADRLPSPDEESLLDRDPPDLDLEERAGPEEGKPGAPERVAEQPAERPERQQEQPRAADASAEPDDEPPSTEDAARELAEPKDFTGSAKPAGRSNETEEVSGDSTTGQASGASSDQNSDPQCAPENESETPVSDPPDGPPSDNSPVYQDNECTRPLTDKEWAEHLLEVRNGLDNARREGLETHRFYTIDPDGRQWNTDRNRLQSALVNDMYSVARDVPCARQAVIAGGLGGAGKTTVLNEYAGIDLSQYLMINPDNIKAEMAHRGMLPQVEGLSPMEAADLAHEESSYIAKRLALRSMADGKNIIWDITMSSEDSTKERINNLRSADYGYIEGTFVDIPIEVSVERVAARHREGHDKYRAGEGLGGRLVPEKVSQDQKDPEWGSQNRRTFETIKHNLDRWSIYDNSVDRRAPQLIESGGQNKKETTGPGGALYEERNN